MMIEGNRRMPPQQKLQRVLDLNRAAESLAQARIRRQYGPDLTEREENLRLAALSLDRETMSWDLEIQGRHGDAHVPGSGGAAPPRMRPDHLDSPGTSPLIPGTWPPAIAALEHKGQDV